MAGSSGFQSGLDLGIGIRIGRQSGYVQGIELELIDLYSSLYPHRGPGIGLRWHPHPGPNQQEVPLRSYQQFLFLNITGYIPYCPVRYRRIVGIAHDHHEGAGSGRWIGRPPIRPRRLHSWPHSQAWRRPHHGRHRFLLHSPRAIKPIAVQIRQEIHSYP